MTSVDRDFIVYRRRRHFVDILTPKRAGVQGYRLKAARNFDDTFQTILTADIGCSYLDQVAVRAGVINPEVIHTAPGNNHVRIIFDPDTFATPHAAALVDTEHMWLQFFPVDFAGVEGTGGPLGLVIPDDEMKSTGRVIITGDAPSGADVYGSLRLDLPVRMRNITIRNNETSGGTTLYVSMTEGGSEMDIAPQETFESFDGGVGLLMVRGGGSSANFTATMTHYLPL